MGLMLIVAPEASLEKFGKIILRYGFVGLSAAVIEP